MSQSSLKTQNSFHIVSFTVQISSAFIFNFTDFSFWCGKISNDQKSFYGFCFCFHARLSRSPIHPYMRSAPVCGNQIKWNLYNNILRRSRVRDEGRKWGKSVWGVLSDGWKAFRDWNRIGSTSDNSRAANFIFSYVFPFQGSWIISSPFYLPFFFLFF